MENKVKKFFEIDINDDFRRAIISQYFLMFFTFLLAILIAVKETSFLNFSFLVEILLMGLGFNFYFQAQKNRNYAYWTLSLCVGIYLFLCVLRYTFVNYDIFILYITFLSVIFLFINCYIMSSPLFYPRVQWWEYDFRYRGDIKSLLRFDGKMYSSRLTDLRRSTACIEAFDFLPLNSKVSLEAEFEEKLYVLEGIIKTSKEIIPGRPIRYGVKFFLEEDNAKETLSLLTKIWNTNKKVKLRNKFGH